MGWTTVICCCAYQWRGCAGSDHSSRVAGRVGSACDRGSTPSGPKRAAKPPKPSSCQTLVQGLGLTLVLGSGSVFFRPSPRQTSLEAGRCKIEEGAELDRQEPAGWINEAHRQGRRPVLVEHRGQRSCLDGRRDVIRERAREAHAGPGRVTRRLFARAGAPAGTRQAPWAAFLPRWKTRRDTRTRA